MMPSWRFALLSAKTPGPHSTKSFGRQPLNPPSSCSTSSASVVAKTSPGTIVLPAGYDSATEKRWDEMADCFTDDAVAEYSGGKYTYEGRDAILGFFRAAMGSTSFLSSHRVHQPEIDLTGAATATGIWALEDVVIDASRDFMLR